MARAARGGVADLHLHTTASDGDCTPSQVVALARANRLEAIAITDHDTCAGLAEAIASAGRLRVIPGVEISTHFAGREYHLLAYGFDPAHAAMAALLATCQVGRVQRFRKYVELLVASLPALAVDRAEVIRRGTASPGRRHLARWLVESRVAATNAAAFREHLLPLARTVPPEHCVPLEDAVRAVHAAGGFASLAHPPQDFAERDAGAIRSEGVDAVETYFPAASLARSNELRAWANACGMLVTGGSDFHTLAGDRRPGSVRLNADDFARLFPSAGPA